MKNTIAFVLLCFLTGCHVPGYDAGYADGWRECSNFWRETTETDRKSGEDFSYWMFHLGCTRAFLHTCKNNRCMVNGFKFCTEREQKLRDSRQH